MSDHATQLQLVAETNPDQARPGFDELRVSIDLHDVHLENQNGIRVGGVDVSFFIDGARTARTIKRTDPCFGSSARRF
jgi:hypothetical protein